MLRQPYEKAWVPKVCLSGITILKPCAIPEYTADYMKGW
jgi:hypothetical protein